MLSGCRELNSVLTHPKGKYYHYTTPRYILHHEKQIFADVKYIYQDTTTINQQNYLLSFPVLMNFLAQEAHKVTRFPFSNLTVRKLGF